MMKTTLYFVFLTLWVLSPWSVLKADVNQSASLTGDNVSVKKTWHGEWKMNTGAEWGKYKQIQLERASVEFRKNWARDQRNRSGNRPTPENIERIKNDLSEQLNDVFIQELTKNNAYIMTDSSGENVLKITPGIIELNINAPDRMRDHIGHSLTYSQGNMTLKLEIRDSESGALLATVNQYAEDRDNGWLEWTTQVTNRRAAGLILGRWGSDLREWLLEAKSEPEGQ